MQALSTDCEQFLLLFPEHIYSYKTGRTSSTTTIDGCVEGLRLAGRHPME
nr:hypothetical protein [Tanacetum cinerariifolium]